MKLKHAILTEATIPTKYEDYVKEMNNIVSQNDYRSFKSMIDLTFQKGKYDWFGMWYDSKDQDGSLSKKMLKALNF